MAYRGGSTPILRTLWTSGYVKLLLSPRQSQRNSHIGLAVDVVVCMWFAAIPGKIVRVLVSGTMHVRAAVRDDIGWIPARVRLGQMQPYADGHQCRGRPERRCRVRTEGKNCNRSAKEGRRRKVRSGTSRTYATQGQYEEDETDAVAQQADDERFTKNRQARQTRAQGEPNAGIDDAGNGPLGAGQEQCIVGGNLAREVVVQCPAQASRCDQ